MHTQFYRPILRVYCLWLFISNVYLHFTQREIILCLFSSLTSLSLIPSSSIHVIQIAHFSIFYSWVRIHCICKPPFLYSHNQHCEYCEYCYYKKRNVNVFLILFPPSHLSSLLDKAKAMFIIIQCYLLFFASIFQTSISWSEIIQCLSSYEMSPYHAILLNMILFSSIQVASKYIITSKLWMYSISCVYIHHFFIHLSVFGIWILFP